jgi:hypothetical protein
MSAQHEKSPFTEKYHFETNIPYLGGKGGRQGQLALEKFAYPGQILQSWAPLAMQVTAKV